MNPEGNKPRLSRSQIYLGAAVLVVALGILIGLVVLGRRLWPPAQPTREVALATTTPGLPGVGPGVSASPGAEATAAACGPVPVGWIRYTVQAGDTLSELADQARTSQEKVLQANCLASAELREGQQIYLPPAPTPTPCAPSPPLNWGLYAVQSGDTLLSLAAARETTVDEVMHVNCLSSADVIAEGQQLYLPLLPTPVPTETEPPPTAAPLPIALATPAAPLPAAPAELAEPAAPEAPSAPAAQPPSPSQPLPSAAEASSFSQRREDLPRLIPMSPGSPFSGYPCATKKPDPWIHAYPEKYLNQETQEFVLEPGQSANLFVCDFSFDVDAPRDTTALTAYALWPDGTRHSLDLRLYAPLGESLPMGSAQGVAIWNTPCNSPTGDSYRVVVEDGQQHKAGLTIKLKPYENPGTGAIHAAPRAAALGTTFYVYYCNYPRNTEVTIDLYYQVALQSQPRPNPSKMLLRPVDSWEVHTNGDGWTMAALPSSRSDRDGVYLLVDRAKDLAGEELIWLIR